MNERLSACITVFVCNLEPIVGSVVGILGCKYGDRMDMLHITWRMLQCSACSGSWTIYLMQSLLSSLAMRFSDTAFFLEIDMGIVVGLGWSDSQSERCTETCSTAGDAAVLQVGNIQTAGTFKPSQSSSSSIANLYFKLRKKCRDCRETAAVTADTAAGSVNHLRVARSSHQIATRDTFIHCMPEVNVSVDIFVNSKYVSLSLQRSEISGVGAGC